MEVSVDALNVWQRDRFVQQLLIERKCEASVEAVTMKHSDAQNSSNEVEVREMIGVDAWKIA